MQEEIHNRSVALATKTAKLTARGLAALMRGAMRKMRPSRASPKGVNQRRQTVKQLAKGGSLQNIEISDDNIKAFDPYARKYGVSYALQKDVSSDPPRWLVFFRSKDVDSLTAAFKEFSAKMLSRGKNRPSVRADMQKRREMIRDTVRDKTRHKHREGPEL